MNLIPLITQNGLYFLLVLTRVSGIFTTLFIFRRDYLPARILLVFSLTLSLMVVISQPTGQFPDANYINLPFAIITQLIVGLTIGFIINIFSEIFLSTGQFISTQMGLGFINFFVPKVGSITPVSQFLLILSFLIFFNMNAHLLLIKIIVDSFEVKVNLWSALNREAFLEVMLYTKELFSATFMLSLSVMICILITNISVAFMTKFSPQLNLFSIGINLSLIIGFFLLYLIFDNLMNQGGILLKEVMAFAARILMAFTIQRI